MKKYDLNTIKSFFNTFMITYFPLLRGQIPEINFKVKTHIKAAGWYSPKENTMYINPDFMINDLTSLQGIVYHEAIHYVDQWINPQLRIRSRELSKHMAHSGFFKETMDRINKKEGFELVTIEQKVGMDWKSNRDFYVYILVDSIGRRTGFWTSKHDERIDEKLKNFLSTQKYKGFVYFPSGVLEYKLLPKATFSQMKYKISLGYFEDLKLDPEELEKVDSMIKKQLNESFDNQLKISYLSTRDIIKKILQESAGE